MRKLLVFLTCSVLMLTFPGSLFAEDAKARKSTIPEMMANTKKCVVFLGTIGENNVPYLFATGSLVMVDGVFYLVTAKHVIYDKQRQRLKDENLAVFYNMTNGKAAARTIASFKNDYIYWVFHQDPEVDIAMIPFPIDLNNDDVRVISDDLFTGTERLFELYDVFFLSYQPGIELGTRISPVARSGMVSIINPDNTFYIDAFAFPGNSGSPVFVKPSPIRFDKKGTVIGADELGGAFVGIVGEYVTYQEVAISVQTNRPRVVFEENIGLSKVWSTSFLREIIESVIFKEQAGKIKGVAGIQS